MTKEPYRSTFFFPLRTNVEYFRSKATYVDLGTRVKLALLLYDRVVFQGGIYWCSLGPKGSMDGIRPPLASDNSTEFTDDHESDHFWLRMKPSDSGPDVPFTTILESPLQKYYKSNFHVLFDEIQSAGIGDVEVLPITMRERAKSAAGRLSNDALRKLEVDQSEHFLYKKIFDNLYLDLIMLSDLSWPACLDQLHSGYVEEIASGHFHANAPPGFLSMELSFPNIGSIEWDGLADLRKEASVLSLRKKLVEVENDVRGMLGEASSDEIKEEIGRSLIHELVVEIFTGQSSLAKDIGSHTKDLALDVIGGILPGAAIASIGVKTARTMKKVLNHEQFSNSWIAGFIRTKSAVQSD